MKRINSKAALLKKRVKVMHGRAEFAGILYLLGTLALTALVALFPLINGTVLAPDAEFPALAITAMTFYQPFVDLFNNLSALTAPIIVNAVIALLYALLLIILVVNVFRSLSKLSWLFKTRASYTNGFNRNMYAMDDLADIFSSTFAAIIVCHLFIFLLSPVDTRAVTMASYIMLGAGGVIHLLAGLVGGSVTLFTTGDNIEEEPREHGLFLFFLRNIIQIAATGAILWVMITYYSSFGVQFTELIDKLAVQMDFTWLTENIMTLIPFIIEIVLWIFIVVLIKHSVNATEFNRDCMDGAGMNNFAVFSLLSAICLAAIIALPYVGIGTALEGEAFTFVIVAAAVAFVAFLLDCIIRPRGYGKSDEAEMQAYLYQK